MKKKKKKLLISKNRSIIDRNYFKSWLLFSYVCILLCIIIDFRS